MAFPTPTHPGDMSVAIALPNPLLADNAEAFYDCVLSGGEEARAELDCSSAALLAIQPLPVRSIQEIAAIPDPDERARELYFSNPDLDCPTVQALIASLVKTFHGAVSPSGSCRRRRSVSCVGGSGGYRRLQCRCRACSPRSATRDEA